MKAKSRGRPDLLALAAVAALGGGRALAEPSYPAALDRDSISAWLQQATDVAPDEVVALSASTATAIVGRAAVPGKPVEVLLRAVALTPEAAARSGMLAWEMKLQVDCAGGRVRPGATLGYAARRPDGEAMTVAPAQSDWRRPPPGTVLANAWRSVCDPDFQPPLAAPAPRLAHTASTLAAAPAPAPKTDTRVAEAAAAPAPASGPQGLGKAQVVSSPRKVDTTRTLARLHARFPDALSGLETGVEQAEIDGRTYYRGMVSGFSTHGDAAAFCQTLKSRGQDCLAR